MPSFIDNVFFSRAALFFRLNLTEVHHRPAFTNLHKKLLLQADTSESFLSLQRLMAKHKVKNSIIDRVFSKLKIPLLVSCSSESLKEEESKMFVSIFRHFTFFVIWLSVIT